MHAFDALLNQWVDESWQPQFFFSRKLKLKETCLSAFSREWMAICFVTINLPHLLESRDFTLYRNHKPMSTLTKPPAISTTPGRYHYSTTSYNSLPTLDMQREWKDGRRRSFACDCSCTFAWAGLKVAYGKRSFPGTTPLTWSEWVYVILEGSKGQADLLEKKSA